MSMPQWFAVKTLALWATTVAVVLVCGSCSRRDQCQPSEAHCDSPMEFRQCAIDFAQEHRFVEEDRYVWDTVTCAPDYSCVEASERNEANPDRLFTNPSCVRDGERNSACGSGHDWVCVDDEEILCADGYVEAHNVCINCEVGSDGFTNCESASGSVCATSDECPAGLECLMVGEFQRCTTTCECTGTGKCDDCSAFGVPNHCFNGVCTF